MLKRLTQFFLLYAAIGVLLAIVVNFIWFQDHEERPVVEIIQKTDSKAETGDWMGPVSYADAVEKAAPSVVNIYTARVVQRPPTDLFEWFFSDQSQRKQLQTNLGSGVILSSQGYVITNHHVISGAEEIQVAFNDGRIAHATVAGSDPETDLAVLKIQLENLPAITVGTSDMLHVGDVVLAIGNPFGVGQTVTMGIISATGRNRVGLNTFENFIQTDAAINPGNSGGALINANGELIGINSAIFSKSGGSQGIGFAIPINLVKDVLKQIIEHGQVIRGWLGVETKDLTPMLSKSLGLQTSEGVIIAGVLRGGPADLSGLRPGDLITHINGEPVVDSRNALEIISKNRPGTDITIQGIRDNQAFVAKSRLIQRPVKMMRQ